MACCLLNNLIIREITNVEIPNDLDEGDSTYAIARGDEIHYIEALNKWSQWIDELTRQMFSEWELHNQMFSEPLLLLLYCIHFFMNMIYLHELYLAKIK